MKGVRQSCLGERYWATMRQSATVSGDMRAESVTYQPGSICNPSARRYTCPPPTAIIVGVRHASPAILRAVPTIFTPKPRVMPGADMLLKKEDLMHQRKSLRLKHYDYRQPGYYYLTLCCLNKKTLFRTLYAQSKLAESEGDNRTGITPKPDSTFSQMPARQLYHYAQSPALHSDHIGWQPAPAQHHHWEL